MNLILTICVAIIGGCVGLKLRVPAGAMIGSMLAVAAFNVAFEVAWMPAGLKFYTQVATGAYLGAKVTRKDAETLKMILKPAVLLVTVMLIYSMGVGWLIHSISELTIATALFSMAPAGITDMTLAAMDFDAEPSIVALIQTLRLIFTICLLPPIIKWVKNNRPEGRAQTEQVNTVAVSKQRNKSLGNLVLTLVVGLMAGGVGKVLAVPGGTIAFSMAGCVIFNITTDRGYMPLNLRRFIQMFAGALIGCTVGRTQIVQMLELRLVVVIAVTSFILLDLIAAAVIHRTCRMDIITVLFSCAPGGLTDMSLIAEEMGANSLTVAGMHTARLVSIVALYPLVIHVLLRI